MSVIRGRFSDETGIYCVQRLWQVARLRPIQVYAVRDLEWNLDYTEWDDGITARQIFTRIDQYPDHHWRIENADLNFPIIIDEECRILDGMHRLCKCLREGRENILVRVIRRRDMAPARISRVSAYTASV